MSGKCSKKQSHSYGSDQARPVARAAFFATRLRPAPVFRTALLADFMAFVVLDFLRLAIFEPPDSSFVQLGSFLRSCQARSAPYVRCRIKYPSQCGGVSSKF